MLFERIWPCVIDWELGCSERDDFFLSEGHCKDRSKRVLRKHRVSLRAERSASFVWEIVPYGSPRTLSKLMSKLLIRQNTLYSISMLRWLGPSPCLEVFPYSRCLFPTLSSATSSAQSLEQLPVSPIIKAWDARGWLSGGLLLPVLAFQTVSPTCQPALASAAGRLHKAGGSAEMSASPFGCA